ncbi:MAG: macrocin O-methyltransferase, partial [Aliifodinibius sp.]|nr:macrocin O-methyltransferase [Fodinibius sp.]
FVEGDILQTVPSILPQQIALLRLDTDWYASTKHEMIHLYPLLNKYGVLIIDD